jgi:signal transduction histidine kinase
MDESSEKKIDELIAAVIRIAKGDYSLQLEISEKNNKLDALAMGINMLVDDLKTGREAALENEKIKLRNIELQNEKIRALESDHLKTIFLQNMSHELRTPLNAIIGFAEILPKYFKDKEKLVQYTSIIRQQGLDLHDLINDLLDLSSIETGKMAINTEKCDLTELLKDLFLFFNNHKHKIGKQDIDIHYEPIKTMETFQVMIDKGKLRQIFVNLIFNSLKFTQMGEVSFGFEINNKQIEFFVADTGIGIPPEKQPMVFDRFIRLDPHSENEFKGKGLGLAIVKGLVELLKGTVKLESKVGEGTRFSFTIPYEFIEIKESINSADSDQTIDFGGCSVLIVENDLTNSIYLEEILAETNINILKATNINDAVSIFDTGNRIDVILLDLGLPGISGLEAIPIFKLKRPETKIIVQTAYTSSQDRKKALEAGGDEFITKPIDSDELLMLIKNHLK